MPKFLTTKSTASTLEDIIKAAKKEIYLISPYLKLSNTFLERLIDADGKGLKIHIVFGKKELKNGELEKLEKLKNLQLYFCPDLHAKCYFNERQMVISSMNMYEFSEVNNKEMGVLITLEDDLELYNNAREESLYFLKFSTVQKGAAGVPVTAPIIPPASGLDYRNWKDMLYAQLNKDLFGNLNFYDNGEELQIKSRDHNLTCYIEDEKGKNLLVINKILSNKLYNFLKATAIQKSLPQGSKLELVEGKGKNYDMAFYTLTIPLRSNRMNYIYPQDVEVIYNGILSYTVVMEKFVKLYEGR